MFFVIPGNVPSKSNSYRISQNRLVKTRECRRFESKFSVFMPNKYKGVNHNGIFEIRMKLYYGSWKPDLDGSNKIILDCLQKFKVIKNDNQCIRIIEEKYVDKKNPRTEIEIVTNPEYNPVDKLPKTWGIKYE